MGLRTNRTNITTSYLLNESCHFCTFTLQFLVHCGLTFPTRLRSRLEARERLNTCNATQLISFGPTCVQTPAGAESFYSTQRWRDNNMLMNLVLTKSTNMCYEHNFSLDAADSYRWRSPD
uniref:Uncharacterized protein n=1 Tax=Trichogramma kaykai TaxID=54128 RepID=A0ABD2XB94_9HYME